MPAAALGKKPQSCFNQRLECNRHHAESLNEYFRSNEINRKGLPTVKYLAEQVHLSPGYLSDLLKKETVKNAQDHIHFYLIEEAKNILIRTNKSVGEIAYLFLFRCIAR